MLKQRIVWAIALLSTVIASCNPKLGDSIPALIETQCVSTYPDQIIEFHVESQLEGNILVLTVYKLPYCGEFRFIKLNANNILLSASVTPFAIKGAVRGAVNTSEKEGLLDALSAVRPKDWIYNAARGEYVITLSFRNLDNVSVLSCSERECPKEICVIFDVAKAVARREGWHLSGLTCPIP